MPPEAERIRALAKSDAEKIAVAAKAEIAAAERAARIELRALAAKLAVEGAESLLAAIKPTIARRADLRICEHSAGELEQVRQPTIR
jgi:F0F1-type ATP synthase membrane subunit b/b'